MRPKAGSPRAQRKPISLSHREETRKESNLDSTLNKYYPCMMDPQISKLIRLKRYEKPPQSYFDSFCQNFDLHNTGITQPLSFTDENGQKKRGDLGPFLGMMVILGILFSPILAGPHGDSAHYVQFQPVKWSLFTAPTQQALNYKQLNKPAIEKKPTIYILDRLPVLATSYNSF